MTVFELARSVEVRGEEIFRRLAGQTDNPGVQRIFNAVAADEKELAEKIAELSSRVGAAGRQESEMLEALNSEASALTQGLANAHATSDVEAFELAADYEEQVCQLFSKAAVAEGNSQIGSLLSQVGAWECREAEDLRKTHDFINAPNEFLAWGEFSNLDEFHNFGRDVG